MTRVTLLTIGGCLLFLLLRISSIYTLPIFNDESIYLHWGQEFIKDPIQAWKIPIMLAGRQPGFPIMLGIIQLLPLDPLVSGRLLSVLFSLFTLIVTIKIFRIYQTDSKKRSTIFILFLFIFSPFLAFFDRLALDESFITFIYTTSLLLLLSIYKKPTKHIGVILGIILGIGWYVKSTILLALPVIIITFVFAILKKKRYRVNYFQTLLTVLFIFILLIAPLVMSPIYSYISRWEKVMVLTPKEIFTFPVQLWQSNFVSVLSWFTIYLSPFILLLFMFRSIKIVRTRKNLIILFWAVAPIILEILVSKNFYSRYLVMTIPAILLIVANSFVQIKKSHQARSVMFFVITFTPATFTTFLILYYPLNFYKYSPLLAVKNDFSQYIRGFPSGFGIKEAVSWLKDQSLHRAITVFIRADSGNPEDAMYVYLSKEKNIHIYPVSYLSSDTVYNNSYFVSRGPALAGLDRRLKEVIRFNKPMDDEYVGIYQIIR